MAYSGVIMGIEFLWAARRHYVERDARENCIPMNNSQEEVVWGEIRRHQMEPAEEFRLGKADETCVITHRHGGDWHRETVRPFLAQVSGRLTYLCKGRDGIFPFIPQGNGNNAVTNGNFAHRDARRRNAIARW